MSKRSFYHRFKKQFQTNYSEGQKRRYTPVSSVLQRDIFSQKTDNIKIEQKPSAKIGFPNAEDKTKELTGEK